MGKESVCLVGMPTIGKSTVGKELARKLGFSFIDTDKIMEEKTGLKLQEILDAFGEREYLKLEEKTVLSVSRRKNCVIAPGGSVVYLQKAMLALKKNCRIAFLDGSFERIRKQVFKNPCRGIIGLGKKSFKELFNERKMLCGKFSDFTVKVPESPSAGKIAERIIEKVRKKSL